MRDVNKNSPGTRPEEHGGPERNELQDTSRLASPSSRATYPNPLPSNEAGRLPRTWIDQGVVVLLASSGIIATLP